MNKPLILVVEDDAPIRNLMTTTLKTHDYRYLVADCGEAALREAATSNPDIMLLDLGLPDLDGVEVIRRVRSWSDMPIIVISARSEDADKIEALDSGADDYLTKPFSLKELLARLRSLERRTEEYDSDVLAFGDLKVDQSEQRLASHNSMSLSGKETRLLSYFILNADKELSTQQLLNQAWDRDENADAEDVWIYISYLRQKLQAVGSSTIIDGQKGGPYQLSQPA